MAPKKHWTLDDIQWDAFDASKADPDIVRIVKAASLVEQNGRDYATYLGNVFHDDPEFKAAAAAWAEEEVQHGQALKRWAQLADPTWDFDAAFKLFTTEFKLPLQATASVRGTRTGELISRCIVETGTSSYYTALAEATTEPVLTQLCRKIAADELRHYKLFYTHMQRYLAAEKLGFFGRLRAGLGRLIESQDDELASAYHAANEPTKPYNRRTYARAYSRRAYSIYRDRHVDRGISMVFKAMGLNPQGRLQRIAARAGHWFMTSQAARLDRAKT
jgi:rubrerythrin